MVKFNLMRKQYIIKGTVIFILLIGTFFNLNAQEVNIFDIAREGSLVQLKKVIEKDTNVINKINKSGYSPLTLACYYGNNEVAKYLIENIKDINSNSGYGTALMAAVVKKNVELTRFLLEHKADPNIADSNGTTAMHYAVIFENLELVKLLVKAKAKTNLKDNRGNTAIDYVRINKNESINKLLN